MHQVFNPPPNWPRPRPGWTPPAGWQPDPAWGPPPPGWPLWIAADAAPSPEAAAPAVAPAPSPASPAPTPTPLTTPAQPPVTMPAQAPAPTPAGSTTGSAVAGWVVALLPVPTFGLASFAPPLRAALRSRERGFRLWMLLTAAALEVAVLAGFVLLVSGPENAEGTPTGPASDIGLAMILLGMVTAVVLGLVYRRGRRLPAPVAAELERRALRADYLRLVAEDPALARTIAVGRPDLARDYDDGGLLDLNALDAPALQAHGRITPAEAQSLVEVRARLGSFSSVEEALAYAELSDFSAARLREVAILL